MFRRHRAAPCLRRSLPWLVAAPTVFVVSLTLQRSALLLAQESPNPLEGLEIPATLEAGSQLTIESSDAMQRINEALQPRFSSQYGDATVDVTYSDSATAIQALMDKQVDLAAIGRGLTATEAQAGLQQVPVARHKIAIVTGPDNPFAGSLTIEQFAQIFRGEITNWSEVGGPDAPIVLIDRPVSSDTRQAFLNYPVFQSAPFEAAPGATTLANDSTADMVAEIGPNSIGYAIANQVLDNPAVKVLPMHDTLPDDSRYPFSQPLAYVYRASDPVPAALAYLGYAVNPENEAVIAEAQAAAAQAVAPETLAAAATTEATPSAESTTTPAEAATTADPTVAEEATGMEQETVATTDSAATVGATQFTWWPWLLAIPVLGGLLWWLLKGAAPVAAPLAATDTAKRRIILTPRNCRDAYAYWELPESEVAALKRQNYNLALKLHDVTDIDNVDQQAPHRTQPFDCDTVAVGDRHLPVTVDNRDYLVEMGYLDGDRQWHALARSAPVRVPACPSLVNPAGNSAGVGAAAAAAAGLGAAGLGVASLGAATMGSAAVAKPASIPASGRAVITPRDCRNAYAYWELPPDQIDDLRTGNRHLKVRLYDVTELPGSRSSSPNSLQEFDATLVSPGDLHLPIAIDDRDYLVEVGYNDGDGRWYSLAKSASVRVPACIEAPAAAPVSPEPVVLPTVEAGLHSLAGTAVAGTAAAATGLGLAATQLPALEPEPELVLEPEPALELESALEPESTPAPSYGAGTRADLGAESKIILVPRSANAAYAYWEAAEVHKDALKAEGGRALALRILDATNLELDHQAPHSLQEYILQDTDQDKHVAIPTPDRDYVAELGYLTDSGDWLRLMRSLHVRVPNF